MTPQDPTTVRLDEGTDAGEFLAQNLPHGSQAAFAVICEAEPTPAAFAAVTTRGELDEVLNGLGQYGMEFESQARQGALDRETAALAERGVYSAEAFVRAALALKKEAA
jgi:hypothetical protein